MKKKERKVNLKKRELLKKLGIGSLAILATGSLADKLMGQTIYPLHQTEPQKYVLSPISMWSTADVIIKKWKNEVYAVKGDTREIIAHGTNSSRVITKVFEYLDKELTGTKVVVFHGMFDINSIVNIPRMVDPNDHIILFGGIFNLYSDFLNLDGMARLSLMFMNVNFMNDNITFFKSRRGNDSASIYRSIIENIRADFNSKVNVRLFDTWDVFQTAFNGIWIGNANNDSIGLNLINTKDENQGDCLIEMFSMTRIGNAIGIIIDSETSVTTGKRQHDDLIHVQCFEKTQQTEYFIKIDNSFKTNILSPHVECYNAFYIGSNAKNITIRDNKQPVKIVNYGAGTYILGGIFKEIYNYGTAIIDNVGELTYMELQGNTFIGTIPGIPYINIVDSPRIEFSGVTKREEVAISGTPSTDPNNPLEPPSTDLGGLDNKVKGNYIWLIITVPGGTLAGTYWYAINSWLCDGGRIILAYKHSRDINFDVEVYDIGSNKMLIKLKLNQDVAEDTPIYIRIILV